jgi:hypothetical protein
MERKETKTVALGGICLALTMVFLFGASFVPGVELTLYALSSLFVAVMVIERGPKSGLMLYAAAVILGLILVPNKLGMLPYICLFGYYGVAKYYIEKNCRQKLQLAVKIILFAVILAVGLWGTKGLLFGNIQLPEYSTVIIFAGGIVMMMLYDVIYTFAIRIYRERVKREKVPEFKLGRDDEE